METFKQELGARIARHRKALRLAQSKLAEMVRVQPETICRIESGSVGASLHLIARIADAIHLELHELLRFRGPASEKELALEKLTWFAARLSPEEIELILDVGAAVIKATHLDKKPRRPKRIES